MQRVVTIVLLLLGSVTVLTACEPARPTIRVYGDSLTWEADGYLHFIGDSRFGLSVTSMGGTALCDHSSTIIAEAERDRPAMVILAFTGNAMTSCMSGATTEDAIAAKYRRDATAVIERLSALNVRVALVTPPPMLVSASGPHEVLSVDADVDVPATLGDGLGVGQVPAGWLSRTSALDAVYRELAIASRNRGLDVGLIDGFAALASPTGTWTRVLPCLPFEQGHPACVGGVSVVRAADRMHLCPDVYTSVNGQIAPCTTWSSGAWRYAAVMMEYASWRLTHRTDGAFDLATPGRGSVTVSGWALDPDGDRESTQAHVYAWPLASQNGGSPRAMALRADRPRPDVRWAFPFAPSSSGFVGSLALEPGPWRVCAYAIDLWGSDRYQHLFLGCRDVDVSN